MIKPSGTCHFAKRRSNHPLRRVAAVPGRFVSCSKYRGYVLAFDAESSGHYADIVAAGQRLGRPMSALDAQIASICRQHEATLATRNVTHVKSAKLSVADPWTQPTTSPSRTSGTHHEN